MPPKKKSRIERLKERLYSPKSKNMVPKPRGVIYEDQHVVSTAWQKDTPAVAKKRKNILENTMFRTFFIGAMIFFVLALGFGAFMFFGGSNTVSADNIEINVLGNAFVSGGEELPLKIQMVNRNNVALEYSDLILEYQKGSGGGESVQSDRTTVGVIPAGGMVEKLVSLTLFGSQGTTRDVNITLEYRVKGSSAIFIKQKPYVVNISSAPVNLVVEGPTVANSNQNISFDITTSLNTEKSVEDMMVVVNYPPGFDFKSATPEPSFSDNIWLLGDLAKGAEKLITINGVLVADPGEQRAFNITSGTEDVENEQRIGTQFNSQDYIVSIAKPFLNLNLAINGNTGAEVGAAAGQFAQAVLKFDNNLDSKMTDIEITAKFAGNAFDPAAMQLTSGGFYDATTQTIVWNSQTNRELGTVDPGDRGDLKFKFKPLSLSGSSIKNPEVTINVSVRGRQASLGNAFQTINDYIKTRVKYASSIGVTGNALYNSGPFANTGGLPPHAGSPTTYTIVWNVANASSKVTKAKVRGTLPFYVDWVDTWSPQSQRVTYDSASREIVWDAGTIEAGVGSSALPATLYFQVKLNPASSQIGSTVNLVSNIFLTATDSFTGSEINKSMQPINTRLNLDSNYNSDNDTVQ
jgi:hypothetical protein